MTVTTDIDWPSTLPLPMLDGNSGAPRNSTLVTPLGVNLSNRRSRFQKSYTDLTVQFRFNHTELPIFQEFWNDTLGNGVAQFEIDLRFPRNSNPLTRWVVAFVGEGYEVDCLEGIWQVTAQMDLWHPTEIEDPAGELGWAEFFVAPEDSGDSEDEQFMTVDGEPFNVIE